MLGLQLVLPNLHLLKSLTCGREKLLSLLSGNALGSVSVDLYQSGLAQVPLGDPGTGHAMDWAAVS